MSPSGRIDSTDQNAFSCFTGDSTPPDFEEYGTAIFNPGEVEVPLFLPVGLVTELQSLDFDHDSMGIDSLGEITVPADSIAAKVERELDSAMLRRRPGESRQEATRRFADSIRAEALQPASATSATESNAVAHRSAMNHGCERRRIV